MPTYIFTALDDPRATNGTFAYGINSSGQVVGSFDDHTGSGTHGFLYSGGAYTTLDYPFADGTLALGINDSGRIVGYYFNAAGNELGFVTTGTNFDFIISPSNARTLMHGISDFNNIVGEYTDGGGTTHGFVEIADLYQYATLDFGGTGTAWNGINARGTEIVGTTYDSRGAHGAFYHHYLLDYVDDPLGVHGTIATGINDAEQIVGYYFDA